MPMIVDVIIPALNEEGSIAAVIAGVVQSVRHIVVVDNGSNDRTASVAQASGATVVTEPIRGYGRACQTGLKELVRLHPPADVVVFMDGDGANDPSDLTALLAPIEKGADLVLGSRTQGVCEPGSLTAAQKWGNALATRLLRWRHGVEFSDLGPFRAARLESLQKLGLRDLGYGWNVEMQVRAARAGLRIVEVPVRHRRRQAGESKISGTLQGTLRAGCRIIYECLRVR